MEEKKESLSVNEKWIILFITTIGFVLRIFQLGKESIWVDEGYSVLYATQPLQIAIQSMLEDGLHVSPLYYLLLRPFLAGGVSEFNARVLSAIIGTVTIPLLAQFGKVIFSRRTGILAALLLAINPFHTWYSREARAYALLALCFLGAMYCFVMYMNKQPVLRYWVGLIFFIAVGINSHHFAHYIALIQLIVIIITFKESYKLLRLWVFAIFLAYLSLVPWILRVIEWGNYYGASSATEGTFSVVDLYYTFWNFTLGYTVNNSPWILITILVFSIILGIGAIRLNRFNFWSLIIWLFVPILFTFLASYRLPLYLDRYFIGSLPAFILLLARGVDIIQGHNRVSIIITIFLFCATIFSLALIYTDDSVYKRSDWRSLVSYLDAKTTYGQDQIYIIEHQELVPLIVYYEGKIPVIPIFVYGDINLPIIKEHKHGRILLIYPYPLLSVHLAGHCLPLDPEYEAKIPQILAWRTEWRSRLAAIEEFNCIRLEIYEY